MRADDLFVRYAAAGITTWFMVQALINLAVVLRLLPIAGVPLPLLSYGGSALIANLLAVGVLLACARREAEARQLLAKKAMGPGRRRTAGVSGGIAMYRHPLARWCATGMRPPRSRGPSTASQKSYAARAPNDHGGW